eukprot:4536874-Amphidinium_carterae.1
MSSRAASSSEEHREQEVSELRAHSAYASPVWGAPCREPSKGSCPRPMPAKRWSCVSLCRDAHECVAICCPGEVP